MTLAERSNEELTQRNTAAPRGEYLMLGTCFHTPWPHTAAVGPNPMAEFVLRSSSY